MLEMEKYKQIIFELGLEANLKSLDLFNWIDSKNFGFITHKMLLHFLNSHFHSTKYILEDVCGLFRRLGIQDGRDKITYL